jgi:hypothetical protein
MIHIISTNTLPTKCLHKKKIALLYILSFDTKHENCQEIQEDLNTSLAWSKIWLLRFNETKCIVLRIRKCFEFIYYLNGIPSIEEDNQRDLGVIISNDLHSDCHISHIVKKANQRIGLIRRCFTNLTSEKVSILYQTSRKPSVLTDRNAIGPTISKYISDRMSGKTYLKGPAIEIYSLPVSTANGIKLRFQFY